jgi:hypothetical protein
MPVEVARQRAAKVSTDGDGRRVAVGMGGSGDGRQRRSVDAAAGDDIHGEGRGVMLALFYVVRLKNGCYWRLLCII